jgi:hypothetical protein
MGSDRFACAAALAVALSLSGCSSQTAEERINAAVPPGAELLAAKDAVDKLDPGGDAADDFERAYQAQLKIRAIQCGHGLEPSAFTTEEALRDQLEDKACFVAFDHTLATWLGQRRIGRLLAAPALRPLPATPPRLVQAAGFITEVAFAEKAGIAVVQSSRKYQVLDIATGATLATGENDGSPSLSLSPNGRMFLTGRDNVAEVRDSQSGELLASYPDVRPYQFHWVGDVGALYPVSRRAQGGTGAQAMFIHFDSGTESPLAFGSRGLDEVLAQPGKADQYLLVGSGRLGEMVIERTGSVARARLVGESAFGEYGFSRNQVGLTADGKTFFGVANNLLQVLQLDTRSTLTLPFLPMRLQGATATANPDQLLLSGIFPQLRRGYESWLYSIHDRTLAPVDRTQLLGGRVVYVPSLHANVAIEESKIVLLDAIPAGAPVAVNDFLTQRESESAAFVQAQAQGQGMEGDTVVPMMQDSTEMARARMLEKMQRESPNMDLSGARRLHNISDELWARAKRANELELQQQARAASTVRANPGPVADLGRNATIEAVGVYEAADGKRVPGREGNRFGTVVVSVGRSAQPMILVLSSYEPVQWVLRLQPGAKLGAVLTGGYYPQEVIGAGDARVYKMGRYYAYKRGESNYFALDAEVARWTGKPIGVFQGEYSGTSFSVGK